MHNPTDAEPGCVRLRCPRAVQAIFRRAQLKAMMDAHAIETGLGGDLSADEITVIRGALDLSHKTAVQCMTPIDKVPLCSPAGRLQRVASDLR